MAENIDNNGCSQRDSAEHEGYAKASRSFNRIWKERDSAQPKLLEAILYKDNFNRAYKRVKANKGAPGIDGMTIEEALPYLKEHQQELTDRIYRGNVIHSKAGLGLRYKCNCIMEKQGHPEPTGQAKITPAYNLPCDYVIHTVGPIVQGPLTKKHEELLASCYKSCLDIAEENGVKSIALCCISTGVFMFPNERAAEIAVATVKEYLDTTGSGLKVLFNVFKDIATKKLTVSQLSKFERGQSMLSADRFLLAISGLNMNFAEFAHAMDDYQPNRLLILTLEVPFIVHSLFGQHIRIPQE